LSMPPPGMGGAKVKAETPNEIIVQTALDPNMKIKKNYERPKDDSKKESE
jgi:hypothetical protein